MNNHNIQMYDVEYFGNHFVENKCNGVIFAIVVDLIIKLIERRFTR